MHPLPRDSREGANDLSVDLNHDPRLAIFRQTDNGIPVRMAIFAVLLGVENLVQHSLRDVTWSPPSHIGPADSVFHGMDEGAVQLPPSIHVHGSGASSAGPWP